MRTASSFCVAELKLANLEYKILSENGVVQPKKVAFVGSASSRDEQRGESEDYWAYKKVYEGRRILLVRSADGARAFLYPVVEENDLVGLECYPSFTQVMM
ncbi:hypothetical protein GH714_002172 [Hevea brasiliensis]|uniref:Uncharacterized protein n=1 Tax=Hevea brasiliensis TaxID=3981 RepID=A0A6A6MBT2_HEVBR|nr:hypothetical protein GH714_002172 [Hevea brasiliensis]